MADRKIRSLNPRGRKIPGGRVTPLVWTATALLLVSCQNPLNPAGKPDGAEDRGELAIGFAVVANGTYALQAVHSGKCVDVAAASTADGANIQQWSCNGKSNQKWTLKDLGSGLYEVKAVHSGKCADVAGWSTVNGGNIQQWTCRGKSNQKWRITDLGSGQYQFKSASSGKCMDVAGVSTADGANIQQYTCYNVGQQKFRILAAGGTTTGTGFSAVVSESMFNTMFPGRNPFYTYSGLVNATASYTSFSNEGDLAVRKREAAAFLANVSHETGGLVYVEEINKADYCGGGCGCASGKRYYGRGPLQLSWNYNYCAAGAALGLPLQSDPDLIARDAKVAWQTGLWFWMTQSGAGYRPAHQSMAGGYGFGETIRTINGSLECNGGNPAQVQSRVDIYKRFCQLLGVDPGSNTGC